MREFVTAAEQADETGVDEADLIFTLDGEELRAFKPTEGQFALLMMAMGRHVAQTEQISGVLDFFINMLDAPSQRYVMNRMASRDDVIATATIVEILEWMIEEWGGRPFPKPSASTSSRRKGGKKSTARTPALT
jgi:protein-tyrosine-phosphatase